MVNKSQLKRKLPVNGAKGGKNKKQAALSETNGKQQKKPAPKISPQLMEEIQSDSEDEVNNVDEDDLIESEEEETAQEKKIRLAKSFIDELQKQKEEDAADRNNVEYIARRLEEDLQAKTGKLRKEIAHKYKSANIERQLKGHRLSVTCAVISQDKKFLFSGSKDGTILKWNAETGQKVATIKKRVFGKNSETKGHTDEVLCMAISSDSQYLATGGKDKSIKVWNASTLEFVYNFEGHRDAVSGLVFQQNTHQLYSASFDRSVKVWDVDQLVYIETLFGHQDKILSIDTLSKERCITCGARDRSIRMWKIIEESQLLFNGAHYDSIDCVSLINEETFVSGSNDGSLGIWNINKKKPVSTVKEAHKNEGSRPEATGWINAVASYHNTDLLASGSDDGFIRIWTFCEAANTLKPQLTVPVDGFVNDLKFSEDGSYLVAAIGQEHRLGRWSTLKHAKNSTLLIKMNIEEEK